MIYFYEIICLRINLVVKSFKCLKINQVSNPKKELNDTKENNEKKYSKISNVPFCRAEAENIIFMYTLNILKLKYTFLLMQVHS